MKHSTTNVTSMLPGRTIVVPRGVQVAVQAYHACTADLGVGSSMGGAVAM
jgi:GTP cyclohydrolase I